ncbi:MAG: hypothetical protein RMY36_020080 [Nostoc sp. SerVER01]|nr:hypothetical protein [Nostoc sp. DcaGUA01]
MTLATTSHLAKTFWRSPSNFFEKIKYHFHKVISCEIFGRNSYSYVFIYSFQSFLIWKYLPKMLIFNSGTKNLGIKILATIYNMTYSQASK